MPAVKVGRGRACARGPWEEIVGMFNILRVVCR
jgi:hypothetical protein